MKCDFFGEGETSSRNAQEQTESNCGNRPGLILEKYSWGFRIADFSASSLVSPIPVQALDRSDIDG